MPTTLYTPCSSRDWALDMAPVTTADAVVERLGLGLAELEQRCTLAIEQFVTRTYDPAVGAAHHYYAAPEKRYDEFDSGNFLIAINFLNHYDRSGDEAMLVRAENCYRWAYEHVTETHPMFSWQGGVRDGFKPTELYVKYTADAFTTALALHARRPDDSYLLHMTQYYSFIKQARGAGFCFTYDVEHHRWLDNGFVWRGFGGPILACLQAWDSLGDQKYLNEAAAWAEFGLSQQADDGGLYLLDGLYWNSDLTASELRAFVHMYEVTDDQRYLIAARRFADWLCQQQRSDGSWPIGIDRDLEVCAPNAGPGDMPHIAMALLRLHRAQPDSGHLAAAVAAVRYAIGQQLSEEGQEYWQDENARWGFWSWDPRYDYTLSGDQVVHHVRGILAVADYLARGGN